MPTDRAQTVWREERGNRMESVAQHSLCEATIMHSTACVLHREMCKFEAGLVTLENVPIEGGHESEEMERREQLGGKNKPCICANKAVICDL